MILLVIDMQNALIDDELYAFDTFMERTTKLIDAAREKDPTALEVYARYISFLAQAIANVVNLLDPEVIVLGGGVSKAGAFLLDAIRAEYPNYVLYRDQPMADIKLAVLGAKAGIIGAAMLS